jgi:acetyl-CoA synthetase
MKREIHSLEEYHTSYARSLSDPDAFWGEVARSYHWFKPWDTVRTGDFTKVNFRWFEGGQTNLGYNCLDRHLPLLADATAIIWEPNDPAVPARHITYAQLHQEVARLAYLLQQLGIQKGDRVCLYMPMVPEAAYAMLACAYIGAIHSVVFAGFSAQSLSERINDSDCKLVLTADSAFRGTKEIPLKAIVDEALLTSPGVRNVLVLRHTGADVPMIHRRDLRWAEALHAHIGLAEPQTMEAEDPLFILYTSGSTGKPKGIVHTTGGYMVNVGYTFRNVFQYRAGEVFWCTADVGWITGHSYLLYGPLLNGATTLMFEGVPHWPDAGRFWDVVAKHKVNIFYTAPTAIRALEAAGKEWLEGKDFSSLRVLGSVGEPINAEAWHWYDTNIGQNRCPIVDTWWQTETGAMMISPLAGITPLKPSFATLPLPGVDPFFMDEKGNEIPWQAGQEVEGNLCIRSPWPSLARDTWGDTERFRNTYFSTYPGYYFTGDGCKRDADGYFRITGRVDDVLNVSGHRIGTAEVENALNEHPAIIESAIVGYPHAIKGEGIYAFVIQDPHAPAAPDLEAEARELAAKLIGPFARPDYVQIVAGLPKTRSGKIMRRILRKLVHNEADQIGDISTLLDPTVVEAIQKGLLHL